MAGERIGLVRVEELRSYERDCYRTAYYLLSREADAVLAVQRTLLGLAKDNGFWKASEEDRRMQARKKTMLEALEVKKHSLPDMILQNSAYIC